MRLAAAAVVASLAWTACSTAGTAGPAIIEPGKSFSLGPGESAQTRDGALQIGFEGVTADSRCPKGEQCVWAGDVTVRIWLRRGPGPRETHELHLTRGTASTVRLVRLDPYPVAGKPIAKADYVATLALGGSPASAPER